MRSVIFFRASALISAFVLSANFIWAQCDTWNNKPNMEDLVQEHVVYKAFLKEGKFDEAFPYWERVYKAAPYADGKRADHFYDGQQFYIRFHQAAGTDGDKAKFRDQVIALFDQEVSCTGKTGPILGRKGYYMFYNLASPYPETYKALKASMDAAGNETEYIVLVPMAYVLVDQYLNKRITVDEARDVYTRLVQVADQKIAAGGTYAAQYQQAKDAMMPTLEQIEGQLFDCAWFKGKLEPVFRENPNDIQKVMEIYKRLQAQKCPQDDPFVMELAAKVKADYMARNPGAYAEELAKEGKYAEALAKYREAVETEENAEKKADYYYEIAMIEFRHMERFATARDFARKALKIRPNWGLPYILIGDMYARSYRSCGGSDFEQRCVILAAIEKYSEAKAMDPSIASQANERISRYLSARPSYEDGHMLGKAEGQSQAIGCWIGETVTLRFNK